MPAISEPRTCIRIVGPSGCSYQAGLGLAAAGRHEPSRRRCHHRSRSVVRRIGVLPVNDTAEWFDAAATLAGARRPRAGKLAIVAKGEGAALLASAPIEAENLLASFQDHTIQALRPFVGGNASTNPVVFDRNVTGEHYAAALSALSDDDNVSAVLVIHSPPSIGFNATQALHRLAEVASKRTLDVLVCWFGSELDNNTRSVLAAANVTPYDTPEQAARAFVYLARHRRNQNEMRQIPIARRQQLIAEPRGPAEPETRPLLLTDEKESADYLKAFGAIWRAIQTDRDVLDQDASAAVLRAYGLQAARPAPGTVRPLPASLSIGNDPAFGRFILVDAAGHRDVLLPPLNQELTRDVAARAQAILHACGDTIDAEAIQSALVRLANMAVELPEIAMLQSKAVVSNDGDFTIRGAQIRVAAPNAHDIHLSFRPYPIGLEERVRTKQGEEVLIRPMRLQDIRLYRRMLERIPADDLFLRFFGVIRDVAHAIPIDVFANLIHLDYSRDMTFVAIGATGSGEPEALGVVDAFVSPGRDNAEYSILVRSDLARTGLGLALMQKLINYCRTQEIRFIFGIVLRRNARMLGLCAKLGFIASAADDDDSVKVTLTL
jgi:acetyltransferase